MMQNATNCAVCGIRVDPAREAVRIEKRSVFAQGNGHWLRNVSAVNLETVPVEEGIAWLRATKNTESGVDYCPPSKDLQEYKWGKEEAVKARAATVEELRAVAKEEGLGEGLLFGEDELKDQTDNNITEVARDSASALPIPELVYGAWVCAQCAEVMLRSHLYKPKTSLTLTLEHPADFELALDFFRFLDTPLFRGLHATLYRDSNGRPLLRMCRAGASDVVVDLHRRIE